MGKVLTVTSRSRGTLGYAGGALRNETRLAELPGAQRFADPDRQYPVPPKIAQRTELTSFAGRNNPAES
jgi:hypothetical protein